MRLIIDIPQDKYDYIKVLNDGNTDYQTTLNLYKAVKNGTPLDDIMTHLQKMADDEWNQQVGASKGLEDAIEVIESYTERSEGMSKARYKQGRKINSISEFDSCESLWYKWNGRTRHRSVLISLQYRTLLNTIISGRLYTAELVEPQERSENVT